MSEYSWNKRHIKLIKFSLKRGSFSSSFKTPACSIFPIIAFVLSAKKLILNIGFMENSKKSISILFAKEEQSRVDHHTFFWNFTKCLPIFILTWYHQSPWEIPFLDLAVTCTKFRATSKYMSGLFFLLPSCLKFPLPPEYFRELLV